MGFVTPLEVLSTLALLVGMTGLASLLAGVLRLSPPPLTFEAPRREYRYALFLAAAIFLVVASLEALRFMVYRPLLQLDERPPFTVDYQDVLFTGVFYTPWILLLFIFLRRSGLGLGSINSVRTGWRTALLYGSSLSLLYFVIVGVFGTTLSGSGVTPTTASLVYGLLNNSIIGASEELVWRGYIQSRFIAQLGSVRGLASASILFSILHLPHRYFLYEGAILEALSSVLLVIAAGLLFGYVMIKSQSVVATGTLHAAANWTALFWGIGSF